MAFRQTCFDNIIVITRHGSLSEIESLVDEQTYRDIETLRKNTMIEIMENNFVLTYYTSLTKQDLDNMTQFELRNWLSLLIKQKETEMEQNNK